MKGKFILNSFFFILSFGSFAAVTPTFEIGKSPEWKTKIPLIIPEKDFATSGDISYILLDWQENELLHESSFRYVMRLNNEGGVQNNSQLSFSFDPSYQKLVINKLIIHRGDQEINHLKRSEFELMRNEKNADRLIYDGSYSAVIILKDVRIGDVLEYEYTIRGQNPVFAGQIYSYVSQAYSQDVIRIYHSILVPTPAELIIKSIHDGKKPAISVSGNTKSLVWDLADCQAIFNDTDIPSWYNAFPACEISSYKDWDDVKQWGKKLFLYDVKTPMIDAFLCERKFDKSEQGILGVIRFVQDEIRYLGIEIGNYSHQPHQPEEVFKNRFGDCKDKSYLLSVMLRKLGVEAWPAYVHSFNKGKVEDNVPSPFAFNHVIVKFRYNNIDYWVDPTINQQRGTLPLLCMPDYQKALVLDENRTGLEDIPVSQLDRVAIRENLWFTDSSSAVKYDVESVYYGNLANSKRSAHVGSSLSEIRERYLNYCSGYYANLKWASDSALHYMDYPEINSFKVCESYLIPDFWDYRAADSVELYGTINPYNLYEFLSYSKDQSRKMPLAIYFPVDIDHTIVMHFPAHKEIGFLPVKDSVVNEAYSFYYKTLVNKEQRTYTLNYTYKTKTDHVEVDQQVAYFKDYDKLSSLCEESIKWGMATNNVTKIFWPSVLISLFFIGLLAIALLFIYRTDLGIPSPGGNPLSFDGWLILPIIGLYITPIQVIILLFKTGYFSQSLWDSFMSRNSEQPFLMGSFFYFELLFNILIIGSSVLLILLMHQKRVTFPKLYIWFRIMVICGVLLDTVLSSIILGVDVKTFSGITSEVIGFAIWVPYFMISEQVRKTFVNTYRKPEPVVEVALVPVIAGSLTKNMESRPDENR